MLKKIFNISRPVVLFCCVLLCIGLLPVRMIHIGLDYLQAGHVQSSKSIIISESRGMIYGRNLEPLVADISNTLSVVKPTVRALNSLKTVLDKAQLDAVGDELSKSNPVLLNIGNTADCDDILSVPVYNRYNYKSLATHIIGYLDDGGEHGVSGIEKSFDSFLCENSGDLRVRFHVNANGNFLQGADVEIENNNYRSSAGVVLTVDKKMQSAVEMAMDACEIKKGAAVMLDVNSGGITAMVSRPDFNRDNIAAAVDDKNLPLFNRTLGSYPVGSVFKPLVAAAALEKGIKASYEYFCNGSVKVDSNTFNCTSSHGTVNMVSAIAYSCNCYFVNLIEKTGCEDVLSLASQLGFGKSITLADGISTYSGNLPVDSELDSRAARALLSFGQGSLTANILQVASLYAAIATGEYYEPYLIEGMIDSIGNGVDYHKTKAPYKLFSKSTSEMLSTFLELAVREGTGEKAVVDGIRVCGKTATAQSGDFVQGKERLVTWFAGFYPYEKPEYVLVVMCEDGQSGAVDCAPVFSKAVTEILYNK